MKNYTAIMTIVDDMDDRDFDKILDADFGRYDPDARTARNGKRRLIYRLRKYDLTLAEWEVWCDR